MSINKVEPLLIEGLSFMCDFGEKDLGGVFDGDCEPNNSNKSVLG